MAFDIDAVLRKLPPPQVTTPATPTMPSGTGFNIDAVLAKLGAPSSSSTPIPEPMGGLEAFGRSAAMSAVPSVTGLAGAGLGAKTGIAIGTVGGPIGAGIGGFIGTLAGGILAAYLGNKAQDKVLQATVGDESYQAMMSKLAQARKERPVSSFLGEMAPQLASIRLNPKAVKDAGVFLRHLTKMPKDQFLKAYAGDKLQKAWGNLYNIGSGMGMDIGMEGAQQIREGDFQPARLALSAFTGMFLNEPTRFGSKLLGRPYDPYRGIDAVSTAPKMQFEGDPTASTRQTLIDSGMPAEQVMTLTPEQLETALLAQSEALQRRIPGREVLELPLAKTPVTPEQASRELFPQSQLTLPQQPVEGTVTPIPRTEVKTAPLGGPQLGFGDVGLESGPRPPVRPVEASVAAEGAPVPDQVVTPATETARPVVEAEKPIPSKPPVDKKQQAVLVRSKKSLKVTTNAISKLEGMIAKERAKKQPNYQFIKDMDKKLTTAQKRFETLSNIIASIETPEQTLVTTKKTKAQMDEAIKQNSVGLDEFVAELEGYAAQAAITNTGKVPRLAQGEGIRQDTEWISNVVYPYPEWGSAAKVKQLRSALNNYKSGKSLTPGQWDSIDQALTTMSNRGDITDKADFMNAVKRNAENVTVNEAELAADDMVFHKGEWYKVKEKNGVKQLVDGEKITLDDFQNIEGEVIPKGHELYEDAQIELRKQVKAETEAPDAQAIRKDAGQVSPAGYELRPSTGKGGKDIQQPAPTKPAKAREEAKPVTEKPAEKPVTKKALQAERADVQKQIDSIKRSKIDEIERLATDDPSFEGEISDKEWRNLLDEDERDLVKTLETRKAELDKQLKAPVKKAKAQEPEKAVAEPKPEPGLRPKQGTLIGDDEGGFKLAGQKGKDYEAQTKAKETPAQKLERAISERKNLIDVEESTFASIKKAKEGGNAELVKQLTDYRATIADDIRKLNTEIDTLRGKAEAAETKSLDFKDEANKETWEKASKKKSKARASFKEGTFNRTEQEADLHFRAIKEGLSRIEGAENVVVIRRPSDLPPATREALAAEIRNQNLSASLEDIAGITHDGTMYVISDNVAHLQHAQQKVMHEQMHARIDKANKDDINLLIGRTYKGQAIAIAQELDRLGYKRGTPEYVHELIAMAYERGVVSGDVTLWNRFVATMRQLFRKWGVKFDISDNDLRVIAQRYIANDVTEGLGLFNLLDVPLGREVLSAKDPNAGVNRIKWEPSESGNPHVQGAKRAQGMMDYWRQRAAEALKKEKPPIADRILENFYDRNWRVVKVMIEKGMMKAREQIKDLRRAPAKAAYAFEKVSKQIEAIIPDADRQKYSDYRTLKRLVEIKENVEAYRKLQDPSVEIVTNESYTDAKNWLNELARKEPDVLKRFQEADVIFKKTVSDLLEKRHSEGMISDDAYANMKLLQPDYHPRLVLKYIDPDSIQTGPGRGQPTLSTISALKGTDLPMLNDWKVAMAQIHQRHFGATEAQKLNMMMLKSIDEGNPFNLSMKPSANDAKIDYVAVPYMEKGVRKEFYMPKYFADGFLTQQPLVNSKWRDMIRWVSGKAPVQLLATGANPAFAISNIPIDMIHQYMTKDAYSAVLPKAIGQMIRNMVQVAPDVWKMRGDAAYLAEMGQLGNTMMSISSIGAEAVNRNPDAFAGGIDRRVSSIAEVLGRLGNFSEMLGRVAYMKQAQKKWTRLGKSPAEAKWLAAKEAMSIVDYGQGGNIAKALDNALPYFNANLEVASGLFKAYKRNKTEFLGKAAQLILFGTAYGMANRLYRGKEIDSISDRERVNSLVLPIGIPYKDQAGNERTVYLRVNMNPAARVFKQIGEEIAEKVMGGNPSSDRLWMAYQDAVLIFKTDQFIPPTLKAILTYSANKDFWRNEDVWKGAKVKPFAEYTSYTPKPYVDIGKATGMSPEKLQRATQQIIVPNNFFSGLLNVGWDLMVPQDEKINKEMIERIIAIPGVNKVLRISRPVELTERQKIQARDLRIDTKKLPPLLVAKKIEEATVEKNTERAERNVVVDNFVKKIKRKEINANEFRKWLNTIPQDDRSRVIRRYREKMGIM